MFCCELSELYGQGENRKYQDLECLLSPQHLLEAINQQSKPFQLKLLSEQNSIPSPLSMGKGQMCHLQVCSINFIFLELLRNALEETVHQNKRQTRKRKRYKHEDTGAKSPRTHNLLTFNPSTERQRQTQSRLASQTGHKSDPWVQQNLPQCIGQEVTEEGS